MSVYNIVFDVEARMCRHDDETELKRWFNNYKINHLEVFCSSEEWLVIDRVPVVLGRREKTQYIGKIGDDERYLRVVKFDPTAPPPPLFSRPAITSRRERQYRSGSYSFEAERRVYEEMKMRLYQMQTIQPVDVVDAMFRDDAPLVSPASLVRSAFAPGINWSQPGPPPAASRFSTVTLTRTVPRWRRND